MTFKRNTTRYAHAEGHTSVCYTTDGSHMITCGSDGDFRIWAGLEDDDPSSQCVGEWALCIAYSSYNTERLFVTSDNNAVQAYTYPGGDKDGIIMRFTAPVSHFVTGPKLLVAGAQDYEIRAAPLLGGEPISFSGHTGPVLSVAICPMEQLIASSSGDGSLRIWSLKDKSQIRQYDCIPKVNSFASAKVLGMPSFEPINGKYLAYPSDKEIVVVDTVSWQKKYSFTHVRIKNPISLCMFSPCGAFIAGSTTIGQICIWDLATERCSVLSDHPNLHNICSMAWNPSGNGELAFCDNYGQLGTIEDCYNRNNTADDVSIKDYDDLNLDCDSLVSKEQSDDENGISLEKIKNETLKPVIQEDDGASSCASIDKDSPAVPKHVLQKPFQPGSTPSHLENRYMVWNGTGIVRAHSSDVENSISVEFHDSKTHHSIHMNNYLNHTMASLSSSVLALASETPSKLVCITLGSSGSREWTTEMPQEEEILAIAAGDKLVAVATDLRMLRFFTIYGTQREVIAIPGPVVCLAGFGHMILVVYNYAPSFTDDLNLNVMFIQAIGLKIKCNDMRLPLNPGSQLTWLGFTDRGSPAFLDSTGILKIYNMSSNVWFPLCDTTLHVKGVSDRFFIVEINESKQTLFAVLCRGSNYPKTNPRPAVSQLPLQFPMCEMETEKSNCEEQLCRWSVCSVDQEERQFKETALKLFALACRGGLEQRAQELMEMIGAPELISLAVKYASKLGLMHLADKLNTLAKDMESNRPESPMPINEEDNGTSFITSAQVHNSSLLEKKETCNTPVIAPLALRALSQKRNPFKRNLSPNSGNPNALQHLTDKIVGLSKENQSSNINDEQHDEIESVENTPKNESFVRWFAREKSALENEFPDKSASDLLKHALKVFKVRNNKRKLSDDAENQDANKQKRFLSYSYKDAS